MKKILFITHPHKQCGVYQFGKCLYDVLSAITEYNFSFIESTNEDTLFTLISKEKPDLLFYNYHPGTIPFIVSLVPRLRRDFPALIQLGFLHEINDLTIGYNLELFDFAVCADPSIKVKDRLFKTGRIIPQYTNLHPQPITTTIGSFGFGCAHKGYESLIKIVQNQFNKALIRINIAIQTPFDSEGKIAIFRANECKKIITKPEIILDITHNFMTQNELVDFLAQNSVNAFLYDDSIRQGGMKGDISSTIDFALAARRPIAISKSSMFRHVSNTTPSIIINETPLQEIINNGLIPLEKFYDIWTAEKVRKEYVFILDRALKSSSQKH
jgi:hypothetical protein